MRKVLLNSRRNPVRLAPGMVFGFVGIHKHSASSSAAGPRSRFTIAVNGTERVAAFPISIAPWVSVLASICCFQSTGLLLVTGSVRKSTTGSGTVGKDSAAALLFQQRPALLKIGDGSRRRRVTKSWMLTLRRSLPVLNFIKGGLVVHERYGVCVGNLMAVDDVAHHSVRVHPGFIVWVFFLQSSVKFLVVHERQFTAGRRCGSSASCNNPESGITWIVDGEYEPREFSTAMHPG